MSWPAAAAAEPDALPPLPADSGAVPLLVIGAGVIGLSVALRAAQAGQAVTVIDGAGIAAGASRGNAGAFAFSDIVPLASPGVWRQVPRWLLDPLGPLALRPGYLPRIAPWLWRFWRASRADRVRESVAALATLNALSARLTPALLAAAGCADQLRQDGNLHLYDSHDQWRATLPQWQWRSDHGMAVQHVRGADAIAALQPGLHPRFTQATFVPGWATIDDPLALVRQLAAALIRHGGRLYRAQAQALQPAADSLLVQMTDGRQVRASRLVLAAGAWSHRLAATLGEQVPLETERGYNTTLPATAFALQRQLTFCNHGFVVTPVGGGVRVGGAVELAGLEAEPDWRRADALLARAQAFMPGLDTTGGTRWMGFRPSLPDSLPAIGPSSQDARVIHAFGHGHLGLTQAAATAELVLNLLLDSPPAIDLAPFSPARF